MNQNPQVPSPPVTRWSTGIERTFRAVEPGIYQEIMLHFMHKKNGADEIISSKLDKVISGRLFKIAQQGEHSLHGEYTWTLADGREVRLIGLGV